MLLFVLALATTASANEACTAEEQQSSLVDAFTAWGGTKWHNKKGWLDSTLECRLKDIQFPAHCCWHGITCCTSSTCSETERPDVDRCGCKQGLVWGINLDSNNLVGNFTRFDHTPFACSLQRLKLSYNDLSGKISDSIKVHKRLSSLELQANELQGTLPTEMGQVPSLRLVLLSSNMLEGTVPPDICSNASRLSSLAIDDNNFSGLLDLTHCKKLTYVAAKGNSLVPYLEGVVLPELKSVFLEDNSLEGALPGDIFANFVPNLEQLAISKNKLSGRLPDMSMYSLKNVILDENRFVGPIPDSWSRIARPNSLVRLDTNYLSCCGIKPMTIQQLLTVNRTLHIDEVYEGVNYSAPLLPPFLELSDELEPVTVKLQQSFKAAGMRCPTIRIAGQEANPEGTLDWFLDPSYYMFEKCECDEGLRLVNLTKPGHIFYFECRVPEVDSSSSSDQTWVEAYPWTVVIIVVVGCLLLVMTSFALYLYKGKEVLRKFRNLKKRTQGLPSSGPFVAVVTDIQGWTNLCAMHPDLSMKVLGIHNSILRKARWMNFGSTHETEGDSFTIVFCDAKDAAAFCLQAQQMLNMQQWPCPRQSSNSEEIPFPHMKSYVNPLSKLSMVPTIKDFSIHAMPKLQTVGSLKHQSHAGGVASLDVHVRMGMALGFLHTNESLHGHPTIAKAKEVCDAAVGGQILMEGNAFAAIKDSLGELGTVDAQGIHPDRIRMRRVFTWSAWFLCWFVRAPAASNEDAVVLDMGCYVRPTEGDKSKEMPVVGDRSRNVTPPPSVPHTMVGGSTRNSAHKPLTRMSKLSSFGSAHKHSSLTEIHLYQILSPVDAENSKAWGSNLRLHNELRLKSSLAKGYFDAPGTLAAPLGVAKNSDDITLPLVTTVFASVEHAKLLSSKEVRQVERGLLQSARSCLDQVQGDGYLCRVFGNLKLMLCFSKPEAALAWSCAMQESMMAQAWPKAVLKDPFREGRDKQGHLIFRGPRLKIGISQGRPDSIQPDHLGRADYHGDCVNSAARFTEGAAQGGMIVCEQDVAVRAAETWAALRPLELNPAFRENIVMDAERRSTPCPWPSAQLRKQHSSVDSRGREASPSSPGTTSNPSHNLEDGQLQHSLNRHSASHSEPLYSISQQPHSPAQICVAGNIERGGSRTNQQCLSKVNIYWMGSFCFKGMSHVRRMVYVLQERLASRATGYTPKSLNHVVASMVSQFQPQGPNVTSYLVPLPVVDVDLGPPREARRRPTSVRFELESSQTPDDASSIQGDSLTSWKRASSSAEIVPMP